MARILLVEDDDTLRSLLQTILEHHGHRVVACSSLARARVELLRAPIDVMVLDEVLPDGSGLEFIDGAKREGWVGPVILVTGFDLDLTRAKSPGAASVSAVLQKPVAGRDLLAAIDASLEQPTPNPVSLADHRQQTRSGFAAQLGARIAHLTVEIDRLRQGSDKPRAAQRQARKIRQEATEHGFPKLARILDRIEFELETLPLGAASTPEDHRRLGLLLDQAQRAVPIDHAVVDLPSQRGLVVVEPDAERAVRLIAEGNRQGLPITVVPQESEAVRLGIMEPILGVLFCRVTPDVVGSAERIRASSNNNTLLVAAIPEGRDSDIATLLDTIPGAIILSRSISAEGIVASLIDTLRRPGSAHLRALVVDDDVVLSSTISDILSTYGVEVHTLERPADFTAHLVELDPDVVLLGAHSPGVYGFDLCRILRANPRWRYLPVIFITDGHDQRTRERCYEVGGNDFLEQPILAQEMWARIQSQVATARVRTAEGRRDPVTGLGARQTLVPLLRRVIELEGNPSAIGLIGLSNLTEINHGRGFEAGDRALQALGRMLAQLRAPGLSCGRWSDNAVMVIMPELTLSTARQFLTDITDRFAVSEIRTQRGSPFVTECKSAVVMSTDGASLDGVLAILEARFKMAT